MGMLIRVANFHNKTEDIAYIFKNPIPKEERF
jgi:hypothetical protein